MSVDLFNAYLDGNSYIVAWRDEGAALVATRDFQELRSSTGGMSWEEANEIAEAMNFAYRMGWEQGLKDQRELDRDLVQRGLRAKR